MREPTPARTGEDALRVLDRLQSEGALSKQSRAKFLDLCDHFFRFTQTSAATTQLSKIDAGTVEAFVRAQTTSGEPAVASMHLRRSAVRLAFRLGRELGVVIGDPTLDLVLPPRSSLASRPLTDDEVVLCRSASLRTLEETRLPAAWALAECGVRSSELGNVTVADLRLEVGQVWIGGSSRTHARWVTPDGWGLLQLERRVRSTQHGAEQPVLYSGRSGSDYHRQAASSVAISTVLRLAGLLGEPDVRPLSVAGWAGRQVLDETGRIEEVARALGVRSLDRTARLIAWEWAEQPTDSE